MIFTDSNVFLVVRDSPWLQRLSIGMFSTAATENAYVVNYLEIYVLGQSTHEVRIAKGKRHQFEEQVSPTQPVVLLGVQLPLDVWLMKFLQPNLGIIYFGTV